MRILLTFLALAALSLQSFAQQGNWTTFLQASRAGRPLQVGNTLWAPTDAGLLEVNLENHSLSLWNKSTAALSSNSIEAIAQHPLTGDFFIGTYDVAMMKRPEVGGEWETLSYPAELTGNSFNPLQTYCATFDASGALWVGTNQGLLAYDGQEWTHFDQSNGHPFLGSVWDIQPAPDGGLYLASHQLLHIKDGVITEVTPTDIDNHFLFAYSNAKMYQQANGNLWFFTDIGTIGHYDGQEWEVLDSIAGQPAFQAPSFVGESPEGEFLAFLPGQGGMFRFSEGQWEPYPIGLEDGLLQLHFLPDGWVAIYPEKVSIHKNDSTWEIPFNSYPFQSSPYYFRYDGNNQLWVKDGSNSLLNMDTWERLDSEGEGAPNYILDYSFTSSSALWAVSGSAAHRFSQGSWQLFDHTGNSVLPAANGYRSIVSDGAEGAWLYVYNKGLYHFQNGAWKKQQHPIFALNYIIQMEAAADGILWLHFYDTNQGSRIASWDGEQLNIFTEGEEGYHTGLTDVLYFDRGTNLFWTIGPDAMQFYDGQGWQQIPVAPGFSAADYFRSFIVRGEAIVAATGSYLYLYKDGQWSVLSSSDSPMSNEDLTEIGLGQDGALWMLHQGRPIIDRYEWGLVVQDKEPTLRDPFEKLTLFPNPAREMLSFQLAGEVQAGRAETLLFNELGQLLSVKTMELPSGNQALPFPVEGLEKGWYRLLVKTAGKAYAATFLKQ